MLHLRLSLLVAICAAGACAAAPHRDRAGHASAQLSDPTLFAGIPNLSFDFYEVAGTTPEAIKQSLDVRGPFDPNAGHRVDALTTWSIDWAVPGKGGSCDLGQASVTYRAEVMLPRLASPDRLQPESLARWRAFRAWLEEHEAWHARHAWTHVGDVLAAIRASDCDSAGEAAAAAVRRIAGEQRRYDIETSHGANGGVSFP